MTKIKLEGLKPDTDYFAQVRALLPEKQFSEWSLRFEFTTISDQGKPKTPTNVTWDAEDGFYVGAWDAVTENEDGSLTEISFYDVHLNYAGQDEYIPAMPGNASRIFWRRTPDQLKSIFGEKPAELDFRVRAVAFNGQESDWSPWLSANILAPMPPQNVVATPGRSNIKLTWEPPTNTSNIDGYRVYTLASGPYLFTKKRYEGLGLEYLFQVEFSETEVDFKVVSFSQFGIESTPVYVSATPLPNVDIVAPNVPSTPTGSISTAPDGKSATATVSWTLTSPPEDLFGFNLQYKKVGTTIWNQTDTAKDLLSAVFEVEPYASYEVRVRAFDNFGNTSDWSPTATLAGAVNTPPAQVTGLSAVAGRDAIRYSWTESTDNDVKSQAGSYELQVATNNTFTASLVTYRTGYPNYEVVGLLPGTTYYARVRALDSMLLAGTYSATNTTTTLTFPVTPLSDGAVPSSSPAATVSGGIGYLFVNWPATTNADLVTYEVHISTTNNFTPGAGTKVAETSATNIILEKDAAGANLAYGTTYYVKLLAKDRDGAASAYGTQGSGSPVKGTIGDLTLTAGDVGAYTTTQTDNLVTTSANGKNKITYATTAPVNGTSTGIIGDTWYVRQSTTPFQITAVYELTTAPSTWTQRKINGATLDNLDAGTVSTGLLNAARVQIGAASTYSSGYDPSTKETPAGAQAKADGARTNAVNDLKTLWGHPSNTTLIDGGDIFTNSIKATSIALADFTNYIADPYFEQTNNANGLGAGIRRLATDSGVPANAPYPQVWGFAAGVTAPFDLQTNYSIPVNVGDEFYMEIWAANSGAGTVGTTMGVYLQSTDKTAGSYIAVSDAGNGVPTSLPISTSWVKMGGKYTVPSTVGGKPVGFIQFWLRPANTQGWHYTGWTARKRYGGSLIIDGSISANKVAAGTYTGGEFIIGTGGILKTANSEVTITSTGISVTGANSSIVSTSIQGGDFIVNKTINVKGTMTVSTAGWIQSDDFNGTTDPATGLVTATGTLGYRLTNKELVFNKGKISVGTLVSGTADGVGIIMAGGSNIQMNSGYIRGGGYTGTTASSNPAGVGWYLGSDGLRISSGSIIVNLGDIQGTSLVGKNWTVSSGGSITGPGFSLSSAGLYASSLYIGPNGSSQYITVSNGALRSADYNGTTTGWILQPGGNSWFGGNMTIKGNLDGATGTFTGSLSGATGSFSGDISGATGTFQGSINSSSVTVTNFFTAGSSGNLVRISSAGIMELTSGGVLGGNINGQSGRISISGGTNGVVIGGSNNSNNIYGTTTLHGNTNINSRLTVSLAGISQTGTSNNDFDGRFLLNSIRQGGAQVGNSTANRYVAITLTDGILTSVTSLASRRSLKNRIEPIRAKAEDILKMEPRRFYYNGDPALRTGFIIDEVESIGGLDEFITREDQLNPGMATGFAYTDFVAGLLQVDKYQQERIENLEDKIERLENLIQQLLDS